MSSGAGAGQSTRPPTGVNICEVAAVTVVEAVVATMATIDLPPVALFVAPGIV